MLATCFSLWCHKIQKVTLWTKERKRDALCSNHPATLPLKLTLTGPPKVCEKQIYVVSRLYPGKLQNNGLGLFAINLKGRHQLLGVSTILSPARLNLTTRHLANVLRTSKHCSFTYPTAASVVHPTNGWRASMAWTAARDVTHCVFPTPPITAEEAAYVGSLHECHVSACACSIPSQNVFPMLCVGWDHPLARNSRMQPHRPNGDVRDYMRWMGNAMPLECSNRGFLPRLFTLRIQEVGFEPILVWCIILSFTANPQLNSCWLWNQ